MAVRYIEHLKIDIRYHDQGYYFGRVSTPAGTWKFSGLYPPKIGFTFAYDSSKAYDKMAKSALAFGSYYTTHNRGDVPPGYPSAEIADEMSTAWYGDETPVRRKP
jgi:hypothetical protein